MNKVLCFIFGHYSEYKGHYIIPRGETRIKKDCDRLIVIDGFSCDSSGRRVNQTICCNRCKNLIVEYEVPSVYSSHIQ